MLRQYELVLVLDPNLSDEDVTAQIAKIEALAGIHGGQIDRNDLLGRKQLAYPIKKRTTGIYAILVLSADAQFIGELTRQLRINDAVLRFQTVKKDKHAPDAKIQEDDDESEAGADSDSDRPAKKFDGDRPAKKVETEAKSA